jgi:hypothetical protein
LREDSFALALMLTWRGSVVNLGQKLVGSSWTDLPIDKGIKLNFNYVKLFDKILLLSVDLGEFFQVCRLRLANLFSMIL